MYRVPLTVRGKSFIRIGNTTRVLIPVPRLRPEISRRTLKWNLDFESYGVQRSRNVLPSPSGRSCSERTCFYRGEILDLCPPCSGFRAKRKRTRGVVPGVSPTFGRREARKRKKIAAIFPDDDSAYLRLRNNMFYAFTGRVLNVDCFSP